MSEIVFNLMRCFKCSSSQTFGKNIFGNKVSLPFSIQENANNITRQEEENEDEYDEEQEDYDG